MEFVNISIFQMGGGGGGEGECEEWATFFSVPVSPSLLIIEAAGDFVCLTAPKMALGAF